MFVSPDPRYQHYSSAFLYNVYDENQDSVFWPYHDQFYKISVRDQNPSVLERMDRHTSIATSFEDKEKYNITWDKPEEGGVGGRV